MTAVDELPATRVCAALADPTRRELFQNLIRDGARSASALARSLPISRQATEKHLDVLHQAQLVRRRRTGREVRYEPAVEALTHTSRWMTELARQWERRLTTLAEIAESEPPDH